MYIYNQTINQSIKIMYAPNASIESIQFAYHTHHTPHPHTYISVSVYNAVQIPKSNINLNTYTTTKTINQSIKQSNQTKPKQTTKLNLKYNAYI